MSGIPIVYPPLLLIINRRKDPWGDGKYRQKGKGWILIQKMEKKEERRLD